ncbi:PilN domain-containing protein [Clostridium sp. SYSU_GA19001]|uniref:PilN domain-containing protein n=1 Tax=Clostridium caldaquaticum TaxID=2940653 RepID=UPI0020774163|nr:PilN domain-containing protein [Clostridium caldaquaticum]MCM8711512.1 PilN domain-containing protein [Clostridium caldaquaticum]
MNELNLIPYSLKEKKQRLFKIRQYTAYFIIFMCVLFIGAYIPNIKLQSLTAQEKMLQKSVEENKALIEESRLISSEIENYSKRIKKIEELANNRTLAFEKIRQFEKYVTSDIKLTNFIYDKKSAVIEGTAVSYNSVSEFAANLEVSKNYSSVKIVNITKDNSQNNYKFSINILY